MLSLNKNKVLLGRKVILKGKVSARNEENPKSGMPLNERINYGRESIAQPLKNKHRLLILEIVLERSSSLGELEVIFQG